MPAKPINENNRQREEDLLPQLRDLKHIAYGIKHG
jgi:hypothetical protein